MEDFMLDDGDDLYSFEDSDYGHLDHKALEDYGQALNREVQDLMAQRMNKRSVDAGISRRRKRKNIADVKNLDSIL